MCLGLGNGYIEPKEEKVSPLKPYTNNDRINDMSTEEKAEFLNELIERCLNDDCEGCPLNGNCISIDDIKQWLESEAEG